MYVQLILLQNENVYYTLNNIICVYSYNINTKQGRIYNNLHHDTNSQMQEYKLTLYNKINDGILVLSKKVFINYFSEYEHDKVYDIQIISNLFKHNIQQFEQFYTKQPLYFHTKQKNIQSILNFIPLLKIKQFCQLYINKYINIFYKLVQCLNNQEFLFYNNQALIVFNNIQKQGIKVDQEIFYKKFPNLKWLINNKKIYTNYNLNTITGRPSNTGGINFAALPKNDGTRSFIISRFKEGVLLQVDFSAYHLSLIADIVQYQFPTNTNIHQYLSSQYFNTDSPSQQQIIRSKQITFKLIYGGIPKQYMHIQFLKKINNYINSLWSMYRQNPNVIPIIERPVQQITKKQVLFNYLLQNYETKNNVYILQSIIKTLSDKKSKLILYTYDSFLFDIDRQELKQVYSIIKIGLEKHYKYLIHYSIGFNYDQMKKF